MSKQPFLVAMTLLLIAVPSFGEIVEKVVAVVNSEAILQSDFKILKDKARNPFLLFRYLMPKDPSLIEKGDRQAALDYLIGEKILESEIKRLNMVVTMDKVEQEIRELAKRNGLAVEQLYQQVRMEGLSKSDFQSIQKEKIEREGLIAQEVISKINISTEDALAEYLKTHPEAKIAVNEFAVSHIFFDPKKGGGESAFNRAEEVLRKLTSGQNFEAMADQFSEDPNFSAGGSLGTFKAGEFLPEVENSIASLSPGQTTRIVKSRLGFHIVKLLSKKMTPDPRFEKEKDLIRNRLMDQAIQRQFKLWLQTRKDDSYIRINP